MKIIIVSVVLLMLASSKKVTAGCLLNYNFNYTTGKIDTSKKPNFFLEETTIKPMAIVFIRDTVAMSSLSKIFGTDYAEIFAFISQSGLRPGKTMAFYHNYSDPVSLDVAVEVDQLPVQCKGRIQSRMAEGGSAVVAHYQGPYENMQIPYNAITKWLESNFKQAKGIPFEVYLNDPMTVSDQYELKTDIIQLLY